LLVGESSLSSYAVFWCVAFHQQHQVEVSDLTGLSAKTVSCVISCWAKPPRAGAGSGRNSTRRRRLRRLYLTNKGVKHRKLLEDLSEFSSSIA
jgi:hypothetical protein